MKSLSYGCGEESSTSLLLLWFDSFVQTMVISFPTERRKKGHSFVPQSWKRRHSGEVWRRVLLCVSPILFGHCGFLVALIFWWVGILLFFFSFAPADCVCDATRLPPFFRFSFAGVPRFIEQLKEADVWTTDTCITSKQCFERGEKPYSCPI